MQSSAPLTRPALEALLSPTHDDLRQRRRDWLMTAYIGLVVGFFIAGWLAIALDAAGPPEAWLGVAMGVLLLFPATLMPLTALRERFAPRVETRMQGIRCRATFYDEVAPWTRLSAVVLTGTSWPYEVRLLDTDGMLVIRTTVGGKADREAVIEAALRIGLRDEREPAPDRP